jgi:hypothetical protein
MLLTTEKQEATSSPEQHPRFDLSQIEAAVTEQEAPVLRPSIKPVEHPIEFRTERIQDTFSPALRVDSSHVPTETPRVADIRAVAVVDSIREHVQILRVSQQNELQVVLRPDAQTELFLQIRHIDGQIHLQARCERGDFNWLDSQWSAVQNSLANQGVRVEPLQAAFRAQDSFSSTLMHDERGSQREQRPANLSFEQEIPKQTKSSSRPTSSGPRARGWQSWA